jgi:hypothetical protein
MGGYSVIKLVKPIKTLCSWTPDQAGVSHLLLAKTKSHIGTAAAGVLGKADTAVRQELGGFDSLDRVPYQATKLLALLVGNGCFQVLNLDQPFPHKDDLGDVRDASDPGIANQLRIQREQPDSLIEGF